MKLKHVLAMAVLVMLACSFSFAQNVKNSNPYAIFGGNPYVAGVEADADQIKVFVIENTAEGSKVVRLEHNTQTGIVTYFDKKGSSLGQKQLKEGERAWLTQDRFAEKYYSHTPYNYALNNPIRYIDPTGDSVVISGSQQAAVFQQLQDLLDDQLNMSMSSNGTIVACPINGVKQTRKARHAMKVFGSTDITVNVIAENTKMTPTGNLYIGGAFMGNTVNADGSVTAMQIVNPQVLGAMSNAYGKLGQDMLHEVTEAYQGGLISQRSGISSPMSNNSVYQQAHDTAVPQSGIIKADYIDHQGNIHETYDYNTVRVNYVVYPRRRQPLTIMTYP